MFNPPLLDVALFKEKYVSFNYSYPVHAQYFVNLLYCLIYVCFDLGLKIFHQMLFPYLKLLPNTVRPPNFHKILI